MSDAVESNSTTGGTEAEEFAYLDPSQIIIGSNVRTDLPDAKEFRRSIKERGVLEAVTVFRDDEGRYVCLRGQRRTVEAAAVGTPSGTIPCRVVPQPAEADRIGDQMVENIHRAGMREAEIVAGVEQLAERGQVRAGEARRGGSVRHVGVFRMDGVGTSILGRPRPSSRDRRAPTTSNHRYTLIWEEPRNCPHNRE